MPAGTAKVSITLAPDILEFVDTKAKQSGQNRSSFINGLLEQAKKQVFLEELANAYAEQAADPEFQAEVTVWDTVASDGLDAE